MPSEPRRSRHLISTLEGMVRKSEGLARRRFVALGVFLVGLYVAWQLALALAYRVEDFDPATDPLDADCDQCGLTVVLDGIGYFLGGLGLYLVIAVSVWLALRRSGWLGRKPD